MKDIIDKRAWINKGSLNAFHIINGMHRSAVDDSGLVMNELIDGASEIINNRNDKLLDLMIKFEEDAE